MTPPVPRAAASSDGAELSPPLKRALLAIDDLKARLQAVERAKSEPIAVVGVGCRFPGGVHGPDAFWTLLRDGVDAVCEVPRERAAIKFRAALTDTLRRETPSREPAMPRLPTMDADERKSDRWMLELYNAHDDTWGWRNFEGLDGVLKKKIRRDGSLPLLEAIKVSHELWRRHGNNLRWRRVRGEDHIRAYDLGRLATLLKRLRRDAARTRSGTSAAKS